MSSLSAFFSRRLAPDDPRGLPLTLGLTISLLALALFLVLAAEVVRYGGPEDTFDWRCAEAMKQHAEGHRELLGLLRLITHLGGVPAMVLLIGFSRIYLRAHWFTDVLGGFAIGTFWVSLCITWVEVQRRRLLRARAAED